jgi:hypothetical protein
MPTEPKCEGCGKRSDVYGSSWCADCQDFLPRYVKDRLILLREAVRLARDAKSRKLANVILDTALERL